jgi:hypothetical protein
MAHIQAQRVVFFRLRQIVSRQIGIGRWREAKVQETMLCNFPAVSALHDFIL